MSLPKIELPIFEISLPSNDKIVKVRPFTVREEKILLIANETKQPKEVVESIIQVVNNCLMEDVNVEELAIVDLEYIFIQLRSRSVSNETQIVLRDNEDNQRREFTVNLDEIKIDKPEQVNNVVMINDTVGVTLQYPNVKMLSQVGEIGLQTSDTVLMYCIKNVFDQENVYEKNNMTDEELLEFINNLTTKSTNKMNEFFQSVPVMYYNIKYTNDNGKEVNYRLQGINDFF